MNNKNRIIFTLICSFLIFAVSMFRILTESLSSIPLLAAYTLAIGGFFGVVANGVLLKRLNS
ncbi:hypothetical protein B5V88_06170 [Heyndrickxia sporothermodurans]|uniref:Uncharacterized protein n=1 Tax=Heyndrickxia vini TaxID=1476025 RepID=A0ABX7E0D0_9BACI|nr:MULTISPECIES: hypothetical protein [Heyndrickxia]MBL5791999.1 hypothetical protein [Heyndrickxia sporothermodurans]MBL5803142.1 hypothetical protein [Heyndrickxia sporothermodurans]MBL5807921.1 hypothetical protein [Heyndrickxia sporothermodurans]MBL5853118.1 hypothetical protein [Heyndrickxia sporothermodurans]MBL5857793.1 hypothetical protein [Heyndrickxia sporothermodurans]